MKRIYIRRKNELAGHVFVSKQSILNDKVLILPFIGFVTDGIITEDEWAKSQQRIIDRFKLHVTESYIDGRCKMARNARKFNWKDVLAMKQGETFKPTAYKTICNSYGIEIEISNCGSMVRCRIGENGAVSDWKEIHFTKKGKPYFNYGKTKYYLNEFMRLDRNV